MVKSRSNSPSSQGHAFGLSKTDILRGRKNFDRLFEDDSTVYSDNNVLIRFRTFRDDEQGCQMAFITPKRLGKANRRNAARRYLKESYRLHKKALQQALATASLGFHGALIAGTLQTDFHTIDTQIKRLIERITRHLHPTPRT
jgi:ribonuclease P protein component